MVIAVGVVICVLILSFRILSNNRIRIENELLCPSPASFRFRHLQNENMLLPDLVSGWKLFFKTRYRESPNHRNDNLYSILENANRAYILLDTEFNVITYNRLGAEFTKTFLGVDIENGLYSISCFPEERREILRHMFGNALNAVPSNYEVSYTGPDETTTWFEVHIHGTPNSSGKMVGIVMALNDVTERKTMMLQREKMTEDLLQQNKNLEQFAYMVSHNLRAPLTNIIGLCEELERGDTPEADKTEFLKGVLFSSKRLDQVIIDLNEILQLRQGLDKQKEELNFAQIADEACTLAGLYDKAAISCDFSEIENISSIKTYLFSIFYNLLTNSIKYKRAGLDAVISLKSKLHNTHVELIFKDNGLGIDPKYHSTVFGMYKRFHNVTEGKGLGLFMTRIQVEALGGSISFDSVVDQGTEFKIRWPL